MAARQRQARRFRRCELARRQVLQRSFSAQRDATVEALYAIAQCEAATRDYSRSAICGAVTEILVNFPVYRIYTRVGRASQADYRFVAFAVERAKRTCARSDARLVATLGDWLSGLRIKPELDQLQAVALTRIPATERAALRKGGRGHGLLPVRPFDLTK